MDCRLSKVGGVNLTLAFNRQMATELRQSECYRAETGRVLQS